MFKEYQRPKQALKVVIEVVDGRTIETDLLALHSETLADMMNNELKFVELRDEAGTTSLLAKSFIRRVYPKTGNKPAQAEPEAASVRLHAKDPYQVLDITKAASDDDVRNAYLKLVRAYHPDKLAGLELPPAMLDYGEEILKKINAAYELIMFQRRKSGSAA